MHRGSKVKWSIQLRCYTRSFCAFGLCSLVRPCEMLSESHMFFLERKTQHNPKLCTKTESASLRTQSKVNKSVCSEAVDDLLSNPNRLLGHIGGKNPFYYVQKRHRIN